MFSFFKVSCIVSLFCLRAYGEITEIAITIDDAPSRYDALLLNALDKHHAKATFFINSSRVTRKDEKKALHFFKKLIKNGHTLGNHTHKHHAFSKVGFLAFKKDMIICHQWIQKILKTEKKQPLFFRYPYLDNGFSPALRYQGECLLKKMHYKDAPITIDTMDWKFNALMLKNPLYKKNIIKQYTRYVRFVVGFYKKSAQILCERSVRHIILFHANAINAHALGSILHMLKHEHNGVFVSLSYALCDPIYKGKDYCYKIIDGSLLSRLDSKHAIDWEGFAIQKKKFFDDASWKF